MGLSTIAFRSKVLDVEHVAEVLVSVKRTIRQMAMRALIRRLASDTLRVIASLIRLGRVTFNQRRLQAGSSFLGIIERSSVWPSTFLTRWCLLFHSLIVQVDPDLASVGLKLVLGLLDHVLLFIRYLLATHMLGHFVTLSWH